MEELVIQLPRSQKITISLLSLGAVGFTYYVFWVHLSQAPAAAKWVPMALSASGVLVLPLLWTTKYVFRRSEILVYRFGRSKRIPLPERLSLEHRPEARRVLIMDSRTARVVITLSEGKSPSVGKDLLAFYQQWHHYLVLHTA